MRKVLVYVLDRITGSMYPLTTVNDDSAALALVREAEAEKDRLSDEYSDWLESDDFIFGDATDHEKQAEIMAKSRYFWFTENPFNLDDYVVRIADMHPPKESE